MTPQLSFRRVAATWWPLAISWTLMSAEPSILAAVVARLADPNIHLAAYGSVTFPLIGIIQAPVLTLLSLSTAMSKDLDSFQKGRKVMLWTGLGLTVLYMLVAFTPLYYVVVEKLIGAPREVVEPARLGMFVGIPWIFAVAYRRFYQGVLIRFEHSRAVTVGTVLRLASDLLVVVLAFVIKSVPGTVVATLMMVVGTVTEAIYVGIRIRPVLRTELKPAPSEQDKIMLRDMVTFFIPLAITPLLNQLIRPIGSAALSRMPDPITTLAVWPVVSSLSFLLVTPGSAFNEVVIAMLDRSGAKTVLRRFMFLLMSAQLVIMLLVALTPLSYFWFSKFSGLDASLALRASQAFLFLIPSSLISPLNAWFGGLILHSRRSRSVTEGMAIYLSVYTGALVLGGWLARDQGLIVAIISSMLASLVQTAWLGYRSRAAIRSLDGESSYTINTSDQEPTYS